MESRYLKKIGDKFAKLRKARGYGSYETFAFDNDLNNKTVWNIESGKDFKMSTLLKYIKVLNVSPHEFFKGIK